MDKNNLKNTKEMQKLVASMQLIFSEEWKGYFTEMTEENFDGLDLDDLGEDIEQHLKLMYNTSLFVLSLEMLPPHITAAFENVKKRLYPLFEDTTTYLTQEPNNTILLNSINQYESGKAREVSFL